MDKDDVRIDLSAAEALVLFELVSRFSDEEKLGIRHAAKERVLWKICCILESVFTTHLSENYDDQLAEARAEVARE